MRSVTLYEQDRNTLLSKLPEPHYRQVMNCLRDVPNWETLFLPKPGKVHELEGILDIHYVDRNRDLSSVEPIAPKHKAAMLDRSDMQPLLDALSKGDFELAEALTPKNWRLCGYNELKETTKMEQYGLTGWADQFAVTNVPAGIYPIFAEKFAYHERDKHFTNEVHYRGIFEWFEGECVASSSIYFKGPEPNVVVQEPYAYDVARNEARGVGTRNLIYPFASVATEYKGEPGCSAYVHFSVVDTATPYAATENPVYKRGTCKPPVGAAKLATKVALAESERLQQAQSAAGNNHAPDRSMPVRS